MLFYFHPYILQQGEFSLYTKNLSHAIVKFITASLRREEQFNNSSVGFVALVSHV
jgi:hypothetical protein